MAETIQESNRTVPLDQVLQPAQEATKTPPDLTDSPEEVDFEPVDKRSEIAGIYKENRTVDKEAIVDRELERNLGKLQREPAGKEDESVTLEMVQQVGGGALDAVEGTYNAVIDFADWGENFAANQGIGTGDLINAETAKSNLVDRFYPEAETDAGKAARHISGFVFGMLGANKLTKGINAAGKIGKAIKSSVTGGIVDMTIFDPHEERFSNLIQNVPGARNAITEYLQAKPGDSGAEGRLKNFLEGLVAGPLAEGAFFAIRAIARSRAAKKAFRFAFPKKEVTEGAEKLAKEGDPKQIDVSPEAKKIDATPEEAKVKLATAEAEATNKRISEAFQEDTPILSQETKKDVDKKIKEMASNITLEESTRGTIRDKAMIELSQKSGVSIEKIHERYPGELFAPEEIMATIVKLDEDARSLAKLAKIGATGTEEQVLAAMDAVGGFDLTYKQAAGLRAEAGRALRVFKILNKMTDLQKASLIEDQIQFMGGSGNVRKQLKRISDIFEKEGTEGLSKYQRKSGLRRGADAAFEVWINGLLSSPKTFAVNAISNTGAIVGKVVERGAARGFSKLTGSGGVQKGETTALVNGAVSGLKDAFVLARKAFKEGKVGGEFVKGKLADTSVKLDYPVKQALSAENFGLTGNTGKALDLIAHKFIRFPTRALMAADEFFKAVNYRMEVNALAVREAQQKGLQGDAFDEFVAKTLKDPSDEIHLKGIEEARTNTFTTALDADADGLRGAAGNFANAMDKLPGGRVMFPFIRTNFNLVDYAIERNPVTAPFLQRTRDALKAGGVEKEMALAKMSVAGSAMGIISLYAAQGRITGGGPANKETRKFMEQNGWQPYSIKIGDEWVAYDRFDPFGQIIGFAADTSEIAGYIKDTDNASLSDAFIMLAAGVANQVTPDFLTDSMGEFIDLLDNPAQGSKNFVTNKVASFVPFSSLLRFSRQLTDPTKRSTFSDESPERKRFLKEQGFSMAMTKDFFEPLINKLKNQTPGWSSDLPPQRNMFGEKIVYGVGFGPRITSAIISNTKSVNESPAVKEMLRLGMTGAVFQKDRDTTDPDLRFGMPSRFVSKTIGSGMNKKTSRFKLSPKQYDRLIMLSAGVAKPIKQRGRTVPIPGSLKKPLLKTLEDLVTKDFEKMSKYKNNDIAKANKIKKTIRDYRRKAKRHMLREDDSFRGEFRKVRDELRQFRRSR